MLSMFTLNNCGLCKVKVNPKVAESQYVGKKHKTFLHIVHIVHSVLEKKVVPRAKTDNNTTSKKAMTVKKKG